MQVLKQTVGTIMSLMSNQEAFKTVEQMTKAYDFCCDWRFRKIDLRSSSANRYSMSCAGPFKTSL